VVDDTHGEAWRKIHPVNLIHQNQCIRDNWAIHHAYKISLDDYHCFHRVLSDATKTVDVSPKSVALQKVSSHRSPPAVDRGGAMVKNAIGRIES
jgi:hypothetical protein